MPVALLGLPWDRSSSFLRGAAQAPDRIREALWSPSTNTFSERGVDIAAEGVLIDRGNLELPPDALEARAAIEAGVRAALDAGQRPLVLGGDHSITHPVLRGFARGRALTVVHLDAHADLYDAFDGDRHSHACPFARAMEEGLAGRLIQVGIRVLSPHLAAQAARFGVEVHRASHWRAALPVLASLRGDVYVSLDLDVLEPMLAPGISHPEPGGLTVREVLELLSVLEAPVIGADVVEYNPALDVRDLTARVAAVFVRELVGMMADRNPGGAAKA